MGGWRTAEILFRLVLVAVVLATVLHYGLPRLAARKPSSQPSTETPDAPSSVHALRRERADKLLAIVWCHPDPDADADKFEALQRGANSADAALFALGAAYLRGWSVKCNGAKGLERIETAAAHHYPPAEYVLGILAENGHLMPKSLEAAAEHYRIAGEAGHVLAMRRYAGAMAEGRGVEVDLVEAVDWFTTAAEQGDSLSAVNLGVMHEAGEPYGLESSLAEAYYWFSIAAQLGDPGALDLKGSVAQDLDSEELDDANHRANAWRAEQKDAQANADFESIIEDFAEPTEATAPTEPTSAPDSPAS